MNEIETLKDRIEFLELKLENIKQIMEDFTPELI